jgi:hypothetical protein
MELSEFLVKMSPSIGGICELCETDHRYYNDGLYPLHRSNPRLPGMVLCLYCFSLILQKCVIQGRKTIEEAEAEVRRYWKTHDRSKYKIFTPGIDKCAPHKMAEEKQASAQQAAVQNAGKQ